MYVAGVASAVVARTSATFPSEKAWYSVTLIKSDAETRPRPIRASLIAMFARTGAFSIDLLRPEIITLLSQQDVVRPA